MLEESSLSKDGRRTMTYVGILPSRGQDVMAGSWALCQRRTMKYVGILPSTLRSARTAGGKVGRMLEKSRRARSKRRAGCKRRAGGLFVKRGL